MRHESIVHGASSAAIPTSGDLQSSSTGAPRGDGTTRAKAERYLRRAGRWVSTTELAQHLGLTASTVIQYLKASIAFGSVKRQDGKRGRLSWLWVGEGSDTVRLYSIDFPPGFVSRWDEARRAIP